MKRVVRWGKIIDEVGNKYGLLSVIEYAGIKNYRALWKCKCDCGKEIIIDSHSLRGGTTMSCGCLKILKAKQRCIDLTGCVFGRLTVIEKSDKYNYEGRNNRPRVQWRCRCECGKEILVTGKSLRSGNTQSCGCLNRDINAERLSKQQKQYNKYKIHKDYVELYTSKSESFYVDVEDFEYIKDICWYRNKENYILGKHNGTTVRLHNYIMSRYNKIDNINVVDHIGGETSRNDNRKSNLRIVTQSQNAMNRKVLKDNTSGYTGVSWDKDGNKWVAYIGSTILGRCSQIEEAVKLREQAEQQYFGEYSYANSQVLYQQNKRSQEETNNE